MSVYLITGKLGAGKSLCVVDRAVEYALKRRRIVANYHLDLSSLAKRPGTALADSVIEIIEARPSFETLKGLGRGGPSEHEAGLLVLDEVGTFLNARGWNAKGRQEIIDWFLHTRKLGWDIYLLVQHIGMLDKQIRDAIVEYMVVMRRLDKMKVPILPVKMPRIHMGTVRYGTSQNDPKAETWMFRGNGYFQCYDTSWISTDEEMGHYSTIPARIRLGKPKEKKRVSKMNIAATLIIGLLIGYILGYDGSGQVKADEQPKEVIEEKKPKEKKTKKIESSETTLTHPFDGYTFYLNAYYQIGKKSNVLIEINGDVYNKRDLEQMGYRIKATSARDVRVIYREHRVPVKS